MKISTNSRRLATHLGLSEAFVLVLLIWLAYSVLQTLSVVWHLDETWVAIGEFVPGLFAIIVLFAAGLTGKDCYLRSARLSWAGLAVLVAILIVAPAVILPFAQWRGWSWSAALVQGSGGVSQELFFRAALLPVLLAIFKTHPTLALILHSALFGLWHIAPLFMGAPLPIALAIMLVPFICGIGWGWQVKHDGTVIWAMAQHSLILVMMSMFYTGPQQ